MGFFDTVKEKASGLASDAGRASKVTAAQARVVVLQNEIRKAERELGHTVFDLVERGDIEHAGVVDAAARLREAHRALSDKEAEIAALRAHAGDPQAAADAAPEAADAAGAGGPAAAGEPAADPGAAGEGEAPVARAPAAKKPARKATARRPAAKAEAASEAGSAKAAGKKRGGSKATTRKTAATKTPAGKPAAAKKPPASST